MVRLIATSAVGVRGAGVCFWKWSSDPFDSVDMAKHLRSALISVYDILSIAQRMICSMPSGSLGFSLVGGIGVSLMCLSMIP